jgi:hypothetical protein
MILLFLSFVNSYDSLLSPIKVTKYYKILDITVLLHPPLHPKDQSLSLTPGEKKGLDGLDFITWMVGKLIKLCSTSCRTVVVATKS